MLNDIQTKALQRQRLTTNEAKTLFLEASDEVLKDCALAAKRRRHPSSDATYIIMSIINYTNICVAKCSYCAFYKLPHEKGGYLLELPQIYARIDELRALGGTLVGFNGGFHPKLKIEHYANLFKEIRNKYAEKIEFYGMTVAEFMFSAKLSKLSYLDAAKILKDNGSRWITGGGAEILTDSFRKRHSPGKFKVEDYYKAQKAILDTGLGSTATMVIGFDESLEERFEHLERLRAFQDEVDRKLVSFLCWTYKPFHTELGGKEISSQEYLRWLAICRIYLDNFEHIRTSVLTKNEDALQGLLYGANDFDLPTEDEVTQKAGATISLEFEKLLEGVRKLGMKPVERPPFERPL